MENLDSNCDLKNELLEEEFINNLLADVTLKKPYNSFDIFLKEKFNNENNKKLNKENINNDSFESEIKMNQNDIIWSNLPEDKRTQYKKEFFKQNNIYKRELELVKKYIFKGVDGKLKIKSTAFQIFLNDKLIDGLEKNYDPKVIKHNAKVEWNKMSIEEKKFYYIKKKENDTILELVLKYKNINPFILYVITVLNKYKNDNNITDNNNIINNNVIDNIDTINNNFPTMKKLIKSWESLSKSEKEKYEIYTEDFNYDKYNIRNIYDAIYGVKPKTPSGALRIFLQLKARKGEIKSINEGMVLWNKLSINEKEHYLKISHKYYLAYKYKELLHQKKIRRIYPRKPTGPFQFFLSEKKGTKLPEGNNNPISYWRIKYNKLDENEKEKYIQLYNKSLNDYKV